MNSINLAIKEGIRLYAEECRSRIPSFVRTHYYYPGTWHLNRLGFGWDLLRLPVNLTWSPFYLCLSLLKALLVKLPLNQRITAGVSIPAGLKTRVHQQNEVNLLKDIFAVEHPRERSLHAVIEEQLIRSLAKQSHTQLTREKALELQNHLDEIIRPALKEIEITRTASSDISNTVFATALGAVTFNKFTPGGIGIGLLLAAFLTRIHAEQNFFLGQSLGGVYYALFPPSASTFFLITSVFCVMLLFASIASFSGLLIDPLQSLLGIHTRRLNKLVDLIEQDLLQAQKSNLNLKDKYLARIMDAFDAIRSTL